MWHIVSHIISYNEQCTHIITHPHAYNSIALIIALGRPKSTTDRNSKPAADSSAHREPYHGISLIITDPYAYNGISLIIAHPYAYDDISLITTFGQPKPAADSSSDGKL